MCLSGDEERHEQPGAPSLFQMIALDASSQAPRFTLTEEARQFFREQACESLAVVCIVSDMRSGQSTLANAVFGAKFPIRHDSARTLAPGVYAWSGLVDGTDPDTRKPVKLLVCEVRRASTLAGDLRSDQCIGAITALLSSTVWLNVIAMWDMAANHTFQRLFVDASKRLLGEHDALRPAKQRLVVCLRDWKLCPVGSNGEPTSVDRYIEDQLSKPLRDFFPSRHCCAVPSPFTRELGNRLRHVEEMQPNEIATDFLEAITNLAQHATTGTPALVDGNGRPMTSSSFVQHVEACLARIQTSHS
jgi:hypothetical protein